MVFFNNFNFITIKLDWKYIVEKILRLYRMYYFHKCYRFRSFRKLILNSKFIFFCVQTATIKRNVRGKRRELARMAFANYVIVYNYVIMPVINITNL